MKNILAEPLTAPTISSIVGFTNKSSRQESTMSTTNIPDLPFGTQLIGRTEKSLNAILDRILGDSGLNETEYVAMRFCAAHPGAPRAEATAQLATVFRKGEEHAAAQVERLVSAGIVESDPAGSLELTAAGRELQARLVAEIESITARLWGDIPAADLEVAGRVLSTVLRRAAAERE
jgi:DNA-binding MarR family transcriptional regulator